MNNKGFTLLELLIVVLLIGVLGAIALPQYFNILERQKAMEAIGILSSIEKAQTRYQSVNDKYATDFSNVDFDLRSNFENQEENVSGASLKTKYFTYELESDKTTATRGTGDYTLNSFYADEGTSSRVCCTVGSNPDICEIINIEAC